MVHPNKYQFIVYSKWEHIYYWWVFGVSLVFMLPFILKWGKITTIHLQCTNNYGGKYS